MNLEIYVCEIFAQEYQKVIVDEGFTDVNIKKYPCFCLNKGINTEKFQQQMVKKPDFANIIICSNQCPLLKLERDNDFAYTIEESDYCYSHFTSDTFIKTIIDDGGYVVTSGWLKNWRYRLEKEKFTRVIAQRFYTEFCSQIVLLDTEIDKDAQNNLIEFSNYIDLPYKHITIGLETLKVFIRSIVFEWRLKQNKQNHTQILADTRRQTAEYSAVLNIIEKIAKNSKKREIIDTITEIFHTLFGAANVQYLDDASHHDYIQDKYKTFIENSDSEYFMSESDNGLVIKIQQNKELFGIIEASDFLFPKYLRNYTNFAIGISRVSALVFSNAKQYEALEKAKDTLTYTSYHDALTGLYNRNFYTQYLSENDIIKPTTLYMCDLDRLKKVNDSYGHFYGDELIRMTADVLRESVRETDIIARIGGDEFVIIQTSDDLEIAKNTKIRIEEAIKRKNELVHDKLPFKISLSVGYAINSIEYQTWKELEERADLLMYEEKMIKKRKQNS